MTNKQSDRTSKALAEVAKGHSVHGAALRHGLSPSTLFRARRREREKAVSKNT